MSPSPGDEEVLVYVIDSDKPTWGDCLGKTSWKILELSGHCLGSCFEDVSASWIHLKIMSYLCVIGFEWVQHDSQVMGRSKVQILQTWFWTAGPVSPNFGAVSILFSRTGSHHSYFPQFPMPQAMLCWRYAPTNTPLFEMQQRLSFLGPWDNILDI